MACCSPKAAFVLEEGLAMASRSASRLWRLEAARSGLGAALLGCVLRACLVLVNLCQPPMLVRTRLPSNARRRVEFLSVPAR